MPQHLFAALLLSMTYLVQPVHGDDIEAICALSGDAGEDPATCRCVVGELSDQVPADEFDLYAEVGADYLAGLSTGLGRADAWDAAAIASGTSRGMSLIDVLQITNPIGRLHAEAIKACE